MQVLRIEDWLEYLLAFALGEPAEKVVRKKGGFLNFSISIRESEK